MKHFFLIISGICAALSAASLCSAISGETIDSNNIKLFLDADDRLDSQALRSALQEDTGKVEELRKPEAAKLFRVYLDQDVLYTTNSNMDGGSGTDDVLYRPVLGVEYTRELTDGLTLRANVEQEALLHGYEDALDFWGTRGLAGLNYAPFEKGPSAVFQVSPYRYELAENGAQFFKGVDLNVGLTQHWLLNTRTLFYGGYLFTQSFTEPKNFQYDSHTFYLGGRRQLADRVMAELVYAYGLSDYDHVTRDDSLHYASASIQWAPYDWLVLRLKADFADNDSNDPFYEYQVFSTGAGSSVSIWF